MSAFLQSLADALGTTPDEAQGQLEAFAGRLRETLQREAEVFCEGLGTFRMTGGRLTFTPDASVALVVNHRYAGMEPIPLSADAPPAWQPPPPEDDDLPPEPSERVAFEEVTFEAPPNTTTGDAPPELPPLFASDETLMALRDAARDLDAPRADEADTWAARLVEEDEVPPESEAPAAPEWAPEVEETPEAAPAPPALFDGDEGAPAEMPETFEVPPGDEADSDSAAAAEAEAERDEAESAAAASDEAASAAAASDEALAAGLLPADPPPVGRPAPVPPIELPSRPPPRAPEPRRFPVLPALLLLALVGAVIAVLLLRQPAPAPVPVPPTAADTAAAPLDTAAVATDTAAPGDDENAPAAIAPPVVPPAQTPAAETSAPETPGGEALRGTAPVVAGAGFTLVVGGADTAAGAEAVAAPFRQQGYRTGVLAGRTDAGAAIYRAAVGQFSSLGAAQQALRRVPGLPSGTWILNLSSPLVRPE